MELEGLLQFDPPPKNIVFASDFDKTVRPEDYMGIVMPQQYQYAKIDLEQGLHFMPDNLPFTVDKKDLAKEMLKIILYQLQYNTTFNYNTGDIKFDIDGITVMRWHKDGIELDIEPSKPSDYWTYKELEKQWKAYLKTV